MTIKKKNQGFTLVELVIAVVILAIAVSPLVSNFIQSGRMNLKSRKDLNTMNLAQDVMEGISQYTVAQNLKYFEDAITTPAYLENMRVLPEGTTLTSCELDTANSDTSKKTYIVKGIKTINGNYNEYDISVTFDSGGSGTALAKINEQDIADIQGMDASQDIVFIYNTSRTNEDFTALRNQSTNTTANLSDYTGKVKRDITLTFNKSVISATENEYSFDVVFDYTADEDAALGFNATNKTYSVRRIPTVFDTTKMPRAFYFYYQGLPGAKRTVTNGPSMENIKIVNKTGEEITVYIIRTVEEDPVTHAIDSVYNTNYACDLTVEGYAQKCNADGSLVLDAGGNAIYEPAENIDVVSNLRLNLAYDTNNTRIFEEGSTTTLLPGVTEADRDNSNYKAARSVIKYNGSVIDEATYKKHISDGYKKANKNLLYKVTVQIREAGKSDTVAVYTGGLSN